MAQTAAPSAYVDTGLQSDDLCRRKLHLPVETRSSRTESLEDPGAPYRYIWDWASGRHVNLIDQFDYRPSFEAGPVSFSTSGRPIIRDRQFRLQVLTDDARWASVNLVELARESLRRQGVQWAARGGSIANEYTDARVVYDRRCNAYALLVASRSNIDASLLLHSPDGGRSWAAFKIPGTAGFYSYVTFEVPSDDHVLEGPPVILLSDARQGQPLRMVIPAVGARGGIEFSSTGTVADQVASMVPSAGIETQVQSAGDLVFVVHAANALLENPEDGRVGVPAYVSTFSRSSGERLSGPLLLGVGVHHRSLTTPDPHNQPAIVRDRAGYLHVVIGGHAGPIYYRKSLAPDDASAWGPVEQIGEKARRANDTIDEYTYPSLVIADGIPTVVARWSGGGYRFLLVLLRREGGRWGQQRVILDPGRVFYGNWYNRISVDGRGGVFLNYSYFPANLFKDEVEVLERTYGLRLSDPKGTDGSPGCIATRVRDRPQRYCEYAGMRRLNEGVLILPSGQRNFMLATTPRFAQ